MSRALKFIPVFLILIQTVVCTAQEAPVNYKFLYDANASVKIAHRTFIMDSVRTVVLDFMLDNVDSLKMSYTYSSNLLSVLDQEITPIYIREQGLQISTDLWRLRVRIPDELPAKWMLLLIESRGSNIHYSIDLKERPSKLMATDMSSNPILRQYWPRNKPISIWSGDSSLLHVYEYGTDFGLARPPQAISNRNPPKELLINNSYTHNIGKSVSFDKEGLIFMQTDTSSNDGLGLLITSKHYPKLATPDELVSAVSYLTTRDELSALKNSENKKRAFDRFWLKLIPDQQRAGKTLKNYFSNVTQSNSYFTNHKAGYKTDRGMIYIIFGPPDVVVKFEDLERWAYKDNSLLPAVTFDFKKIPSVFAPNQYSLIRAKDYQRLWLRAVDLWRKGRMNPEMLNQ